MSGWAWVDDLLGEAPQFRRPAEWQLPQGDRSRGHLWQVGDGGRYYLLGMLNQGGQAVVWAALDGADDDRLVVVKAVAGASQDPTVGPRLSREARLLDRLAGPRTLMPVLDWGPGRLHASSHGDYETHEPWLALPYVEHVLLSRALRETQRRTGTPGLPADAVWHVARDLASALNHLHSQDVVHRDLSPGNLLLTPRGAMLSDLGMAWASQAEELPVEDRLTTGLSVVHGLGGTPGWYAPESIEGEYAGSRPDRDPAYDVFPWGLYVFCAVAGRHPWSGANLSLDNVELHRMYAARVAPDVTVRPGAVDDDLLELALAALSRNPADRPTTAEILDRLGERTPSQRAAEDAERERTVVLESTRQELEDTREQLRTARARQARKRPQPVAFVDGAVGFGSAATGPALVTPRGSVRTMSLALAPLAVAVVLASGATGVDAVRQASSAGDVKKLTAAVVVAAKADAALQAEINQAVTGSVFGAGKGASQNDLAQLKALEQATDAARGAAAAAGSDAPSGGWSADVRSSFSAITSTREQLGKAREIAEGKRNYSFSETEYTAVAEAQRSLYNSLARDLTLLSDDPSVDENARRLGTLGRIVDAAAAERTFGAQRLFTPPVARGDSMSAQQLANFLALVETQRAGAASLILDGSPRSTVMPAVLGDAAAMGRLRSSIVDLSRGIPALPPETRLAAAVTFSQTAGARLNLVNLEIAKVAADADLAAADAARAARLRAGRIIGIALAGLLGSLALLILVARRSGRRPWQPAHALPSDGPQTADTAGPDDPSTSPELPAGVDTPPSITVRLSGEPLPTRPGRS